MVMTGGNTPPCCHIGVGDMGNAIKHDFDSIWNGKAYQKLRRERWMSGCQNCNLFQTFDDWRIHFAPAVKHSPRFEELAGEVYEETRRNKPPKILVLGAGRDGTRSIANLIANLHAANGQEVSVLHDGGSFRTFSGAAAYLKGDDEWMRNICRAWDADIVAGNGYNFVLPLIREVFGGDLKVIHVRRGRDGCLASLRRAALADPLLWDGYVEVTDRKTVAAPELYDPVRPGAPQLGEMDEEQWRALSLEARLSWLYDASHRAIEGNLNLFPDHLSVATEDLNDPATVRRIARFVNPAFREICPPVHVNHGLSGPADALGGRERSEALAALADFDYHRLAASDTYPVVYFLQKMVLAHANWDTEAAILELTDLRGEIASLIVQAESRPTARGTKI
jgi:hypothetical protein